MEILIALVGILVGSVGGFFGGRWWSTHHDKTAALSQQLDETHAEYAHYQDQVDQHFRHTAELINNLTHSYSEIHQHLAEGAQRLSKRSLAKARIEQNFLQAQRISNSQTAAIDSTELGAPKDYAPKQAHESGDLAEHPIIDKKLS